VGAVRDILLVDDDDDLREVLGDLLVEFGFLVTLARHGGEALARLNDRQTLPDLILLDLMMPVMDGATFRKNQLEDDRFKDIPVFVLSARGETATHAQGLGAAQVFRKPVAIEVLVEAIRKLS
jgi:two-component system, chemotaxis family, chemotaxis protein CheY